MDRKFVKRFCKLKYHDHMNHTRYMDWILCYAPPPSNNDHHSSYSFWIEHRNIPQYLKWLTFTAFTVAGFSGPLQEIIANLGMVGPGKATAFGAVVVPQGQDVDTGVTTRYL